MPERLFDKAEADAALPRLRLLLERLQKLAGSDTLGAGRRHLAKVGRSNGSATAAAELGGATAAIEALLEEIRTTGVILRDPATGLCDFPAVREGEEIYLCWQLAEAEVGWWHPRDTGVAGRQPI